MSSFKISCQVGGRGQKFQNQSRYVTFLFVGVKVKDFTKDFNNKDFIKDFTMDFTNFYGFVKKMVQKNQYTYNVLPESSANPYGEARSVQFDGTGWTGGTGGTDGTVPKSVL